VVISNDPMIMAPIEPTTPAGDEGEAAAMGLTTCHLHRVTRSISVLLNPGVYGSQVRNPSHGNMVAVAVDGDGPPAAGPARVDGSRVGAARHSELRATALNCSQPPATALP
jgi:hypothetical protein